MFSGPCAPDAMIAFFLGFIVLIQYVRVIIKTCNQLNVSHEATMSITHAGIAPDVLHSLTSITFCKPRGSLYVKQLRLCMFPAARCRHGGRTKSASTSIPPSWPFFKVLQGLPSYIAWF